MCPPLRGLTGPRTSPTDRFGATSSGPQMSAQGRYRKSIRWGSGRWRGVGHIAGALRPLYLIQPPFAPVPVIVPNDCLMSVSVISLASSHRRQPLHCRHPQPRNVRQLRGASRSANPLYRSQPSQAAPVVYHCAFIPLPRCHSHTTGKPSSLKPVGTNAASNPVKFASGESGRRATVSAGMACPGYPQNACLNGRCRKPRGAPVKPSDFDHPLPDARANLRYAR